MYVNVNVCMMKPVHVMVRATAGKLPWRSWVRIPFKAVQLCCLEIANGFAELLGGLVD